MERALFTIPDALDGPFEGYTKGEDWNGWDVPYFTREIGQQIVEAWLKGNPQSAADYDTERDAFIFREPDSLADDVYEGEDTVHGTLYPIGERYWCWERKD